MAEVATVIAVRPEVRPAIHTIQERNGGPVRQSSVLVHTTKTGKHGGYLVEFEDGFMHEVIIDRREGLCFLDKMHDEYCWDALLEGR